MSRQGHEHSSPSSVGRTAFSVAPPRFTLRVTSGSLSDPVVLRTLQKLPITLGILVSSLRIAKLAPQKKVSSETQLQLVPTAVRPWCTLPGR